MTASLKRSAHVEKPEQPDHETASTSLSALRSRRALLGGAVGAAVAAVAGAIDGPAPVAAANGSALILGQSNLATSTTSLASEAGSAAFNIFGNAANVTALRVL